MIAEIRDLALIYLNQKFNRDDDKFFSMSELRKLYAAELLPLLVEDAGKVARVYILSRTANQSVVKMQMVELNSEFVDAIHVPFVKPSGSQSAAVGPVIKRTFKPKVVPPFGPAAKILASTLKGFQKQAETSSPWQAYFQEIVEILLGAKVLEFNDKSFPIEVSLLETAVAVIEEKETVFLTVRDSQGLLPGQRQEYLDYLKNELANIKYVTTATPIKENCKCPLCDAENVSVYPNAVKGAGINIGNPDRAGAFAGMDTKRAWSNFALCLDCADLLYIFKNHFLLEFVAPVAGEKALLLPSLLGSNLDRLEFIQDWRKYLVQLKEKGKLKKNVERNLLEDFFQEQDDAHLLLQVIWAKFGQNFEEVSGYITDVLPSRLHYLSEINARFNRWEHALFPKYVMDDAAFDLHLNFLLPLFKRPGGKTAKKANASKQLRDLKQELAGKIYHGELLNGRVRFWNEIIITARFYLVDILKRGDAYGLYLEGFSDSKKVKFWTLAGWIRHVARLCFYLEKTGVLYMSKSSRTFEPKLKRLQELFAEGAGINSDEKAFAFLVGVLYGKLLQVQASKDVNVISSTLPWLKRLQLSGKDLPELYAKICHKFLIYGAMSKETQELIQETARVGKVVGDDVELGVTKTGYFLLLGQALAVDVLPTKKSKEDR